MGFCAHARARVMTVSISSSSLSEGIPSILVASEFDRAESYSLE
jgi:hypothetical protein